MTDGEEPGVGHWPLKPRLFGLCTELMKVHDNSCEGHGRAGEPDMTLQHTRGQAQRVADQICLLRTTQHVRATCVVTQLMIGFIQALVCMCGWAVCRLHANTSLMHAMHAMQRPVWDQSGLRSISYMALKGACRNRTWRSPRHAQIAELQTDWRNSPMISRGYAGPLVREKSSVSH